GQTRGHATYVLASCKTRHSALAALEQTSYRFEGCLCVAALRRQILDRGNEFTASDLLRPKTAVLAANDLNVRRFDLGDRNDLAACFTDRLSWTYGTDGVGDQLDVRRRRAAASSDEPCTGGDKAFSEGRHILGRTHIELPSLHVTRKACIRLRGKVFG